MDSGLKKESTAPASEMTGIGHPPLGQQITSCAVLAILTLLERQPFLLAAVPLGRHIGSEQRQINHAISYQILRAIVVR